MTRQIRRRKALQLSAASALAAGTGGLAGILASGRAPAYAQATDDALAALGRFRAGIRPAAQGRDRQAVRKGPGHEADGRNDQRQRHPGAHHRGDPVRHRPRHLHGTQQLAAALCRELRRCQRRGRGARQGAGRLLRHLQGRRNRRRQVDRRALVHRRRPRRLSQILACRGRFAEWLSRRPGTTTALSARS